MDAQWRSKCGAWAGSHDALFEVMRIEQVENEGVGTLQREPRKGSESEHSSGGRGCRTRRSDAGPLPETEPHDLCEYIKSGTTRRIHASCPCEN